MIKFCDGFVADISFLYNIYAFVNVSQYLDQKKSEIKTEFLNKNTSYFYVLINWNPM